MTLSQVSSQTFAQCYELIHTVAQGHRVDHLLTQVIDLGSGIALENAETVQRIISFLLQQYGPQNRQPFSDVRLIKLHNRKVKDFDQSE